jgi:hypothetical protein
MGGGRRFLGSCLVTGLLLIGGIRQGYDPEAISLVWSDTWRLSQQLVGALVENQSAGCGLLDELPRAVQSAGEEAVHMLLVELGDSSKAVVNTFGSPSGAPCRTSGR